MHKLFFLVFLLIIFYGIYNSQKKNIHDNGQEKTKCEVCQRESEKLPSLKDELSKIDTPLYKKNYIIDIINYGSKTLGFRGGVMQAGFASAEDAPKIACFVLTLSNQKCDEEYPKDAQMFYTSICGGCHGDDGKGLNGNYPDLTKKRLLGMQKREEFLRQTIDIMEDHIGAKSNMMR
jgi:cytochrome c553